MDGRRFDEVTRLLGRGTTRRRVVAAALGLAAIAADGGVAGAVPVRRATCRAISAGCTRGSQCCSGHCDTRRQTPRNQRNRCACPEGDTLCAGACVDTETDAAHCGACGVACNSLEICVDGDCTCAEACGEGEVCVSGACMCGDGPGCGEGLSCGDDGFCTGCSNTTATNCIVTIDGQRVEFDEACNGGPWSCTSSADCPTPQSGHAVACITERYYNLNVTSVTPVNRDCIEYAPTGAC